MKAHAIAFALLAWSFPSCGPSTGGVHPKATSSVLCDDACNKFRELGCDEGLPTKKGESCESVCENAAAEGVQLATSCVVKATTCEAARSCDAGGK